MPRNGSKRRLRQEFHVGEIFWNFLFDHVPSPCHASDRNETFHVRDRDTSKPTAAEARRTSLPLGVYIILSPSTTPILVSFKKLCEKKLSTQPISVQEATSKSSRFCVQET